VELIGISSSLYSVNFELMNNMQFDIILSFFATVGTTNPILKLTLTSPQNFEDLNFLSPENKEYNLQLKVPPYIDKKDL
jgi:hypothetical protein